MDRIVTERLILRRARADDLDALHAILSDPRAMRYWSTPPHETIEQSRDWVADMMASRPEESEDFVVEHDGRVIGKAGFYRLPDIGYILHPDAWGRGLATEALRAVIDRVFERHPIPRITADVDPRNLASIALLERLGFRFTHRAERTWLIAGEYCDSLYYAMDRPAAGLSPPS